MRVANIENTYLFNKDEYDKICRVGSTCPNCQCASCSNCSVCHCTPVESAHDYVSSVYSDKI